MTDFCSKDSKQADEPLEAGLPPREGGARGEPRPAQKEAPSDLAERGLRDLLPALEAGRESGVLHLYDAFGRRGRVYLKDGELVDAELGQHAGEAALYRLLRWRVGRSEMERGLFDRPRRILSSTESVLAQGEKRLRAWEELASHLPSARSPLEINFLLLSDRLAEIPDEMNAVLRLVDGRRDLDAILLESGLDDLVAAGIVARLASEGIVRAAVEADGVLLRKEGEPEAWFAAPAGEGEGPVAATEPPKAAAGPLPPRVVRFPAPPRSTAARRTPSPAELRPSPPEPRATPAPAVASPLPPLPAPPTVPPKAGEGAPEERLRRPALAAALVVLLLIVLALGVWVARSGPPTARSAVSAPARSPAPLEGPGKVH